MNLLPYCAPQLRSYSRHDLMVDPFEDNVSEVKFRKQRVAMERRVSSSGALTPGSLSTAPNLIHYENKVV